MKQSSTWRRFMFTLTALLSLLVAGLPGPEAVAQSEALSYTSELTGIEIEAAGDFVITDTSVERYDPGEGEIVMIETDVALVQVAFFDDTDTPDTTVALFNEGVSTGTDDFTVLDQGTDQDVVWSVSRASAQGNEFIFYLSVTPDVVGNVDVMTSMTAPADDFLRSLEDAQYDVTLDGAGIFAAADLDALEATVDGPGVETPAAGQGKKDPGTTTSGQGSTGTSTPTKDGQETPGTTATRTTGGSGDVTVSGVTGVEIESGGDWQVTDSQTYDEGGPVEESFQIQSMYANGYIGFFYETDAQSGLDGFLAGFDSSAQSRETIAENYEHGVAWSLGNAVLGDGTEVYIYTEVQEGLDPEYVVLSAIIAEPGDFLDEFASAQESIMLDGDPLFPDVDVNVLDEMIAGGPVATGEPAQTGTGTASGETGNPRDHAKLPGKGGTGELGQGNETETGSTATATTGEIDFADAGLISDSEYESPQYGIDVTWGPSWSIDYSDEESVTTDPAGGMDSLMLVWDGPDFALMFIDFSTADGLVPADFVDYWTSADYMSESVAPNGENLMQRSRFGSGAVLTRDYLETGDEVMIIKEAILLNGGENLAIVTLISTPGSFDQLYGDAQEDIEIADGPGLTTFTLRQIERALEQ